jgi:hypothetical protein
MRMGATSSESATIGQDPTGNEADTSLCGCRGDREIHEGDQGWIGCTIGIGYSRYSVTTDGYASFASVSCCGHCIASGEGVRSSCKNHNDQRDDEHFGRTKTKHVFITPFEYLDFVFDCPQYIKEVFFMNNRTCLQTNTLVS